MQRGQIDGDFPRLEAPHTRKDWGIGMEQVLFRGKRHLNNSSAKSILAQTNYLCLV